MDLFFEDLLPFRPCEFFQRLTLKKPSRVGDFDAIAIVSSPHPARDSIGHTVKPATQRSLFSNDCRVARQNEESRLRGILRILPMAQDALTDAEYHGGVTLHERLEGRFIAKLDESSEQFMIRQRSGQVGEFVQLPQHRLETIAVHGSGNQDQSFPIN